MTALLAGIFCGPELRRDVASRLQFELEFMVSRATGQEAYSTGRVSDIGRGIKPPEQPETASLIERAGKFMNEIEF